MLHDLKIYHFADARHHLPQLAEWLLAEWGHHHQNQSKEAAITRLEKNLNKDTLPIGFVGEVNHQLVGCAMLRNDDMGDAAPYNPWLASVYVHPDFRGQGFALPLIKVVEEKAAQLGYQQLYLFTKVSVGLYEKAGWQAFEMRDYRDKTYTVMKKKLSG